jgi:hypothetical protein
MSITRCSGTRSRREFLRIGTLALGGITLPQVLAGRAAAGTGTQETSVILFWMWGGPSQLETYDLKPNAPSEYRGPFSPIASKVPGLDLCELMPLQAGIADKLSLIRSLHHEMSAHNDGSIEVLTGKTPSVPDATSQAKSEHPDFGMIAARMRGPRPDGLPQYVGAHKAPFMTLPQYLGLSSRAFETGDPSVERFAPPNLTLSSDTTPERLVDRRDLVTQLDRYRRDLDLQGSLEGIDGFRTAAFDLLTSSSVARAFDLQSEPPHLRDRYGRHRWGQSCLLARRLAEAGVAVINIDATATHDKSPHFSWDDHAAAFDLAVANGERLPQMDQALSALITDIFDRGLDRRVLVIACGEFGRTPRLVKAPKNFLGQPSLGRDHWPQAFSALISGGGLRMGRVVGATNSKAEYPTQTPVSPQDLLATVYRHLGVNPEHSFTNFTGRPVPILPFGEPIRELL